MLDFDKYRTKRLNEFANRAEYQKHVADQKELFKQDLLADLDLLDDKRWAKTLGVTLEDNPKNDLMFDLAWEYGHSAGYREVYTYALDLVDLIK